MYIADVIAPGEDWWVTMPAWQGIGAGKPTDKHWTQHSGPLEQQLEQIMTIYARIPLWKRGWSALHPQGEWAVWPQPDLLAPSLSAGERVSAQVRSPAALHG